MILGLWPIWGFLTPVLMFVLFMGASMFMVFLPGGFIGSLIFWGIVIFLATASHLIPHDSIDVHNSSNDVHKMWLFILIIIILIIQIKWKKITDSGKLHKSSLRLWILKIFPLYFKKFMVLKCCQKIVKCLMELDKLPIFIYHREKMILCSIVPYLKHLISMKLYNKM